MNAATLKKPRTAIRKTRRAARFTQRDITRAVRGMRSAGLEPTRLEIDVTGTIIIQIGEVRADSGSWDEVLK